MTDTDITELEYRILRKFCELTEQTLPEAEAIRIIERNRNPVGFMTEVTIDDPAKKLFYDERVFQNMPDASVGWFGWSKNVVGFLLFFDDGRLGAIEGYIALEEWPKNESKIKFN